MSQCKPTGFPPTFLHVLIDRRETDSHKDRQLTGWMLTYMECPEIAKTIWVPVVILYETDTIITASQLPPMYDRESK